MSSILAFLGDNAIQVDASEAEASLRSDCPDLLRDGESVGMAFKGRGGKGRDDSFFTTQRILIRDRKGLTGKKTKYQSVPYRAVKSFSTETAGTMDADVELKVSASGIGSFKMDFVPEVDALAIKRFLSERILRGKGAGEAAPEGAISTEDVDVGEGGFLDWIGGDSAAIDPKECESMLKSGGSNVLLPEESVELAFKLGRDSFVCTSHRLLEIDVQGLSGKKVEYKTTLWKCVRAFSVENAGHFDRDAELTIFTNTHPSNAAWRTSARRIDMDFRKGKADIFAIQRFFGDKILGPDTVETSVEAGSYEDQGGGGLFGWMSDDSRMIDAGEMDRRYHADPPILQGCETVEMAFKGHRDLMLFTTKRLILVDVQGFTGKKVEYLSLPWKAVSAFGVETAGSLDNDSEIKIWPDFDDIYYPPKENEDDPPPPPEPRRTYLSLDLKKDRVDLWAIKRYLSERCIRATGGEPPAIPPGVLEPTEPNAISHFLSWIEDDAYEVSKADLDEQLRGDTRMLMDDEEVVVGYKSGRDLLVFTSLRALIMDTKGFTGKRKLFMSVPYGSVRAFAVESAGGWDNDVEVKLWCKLYWWGGPGSKIEQDLRKGRADIVQIQTLLAAMVIGTEDGSSALDASEVTSEGAGTLGDFLSWIGDDAVAGNAQKVNEALHSSPPILQDDETVEVCFKAGRDMCVFTTKRILMVDRQGITGKKVEYKTFPLKYCTGFKVATAGAFLSSPKMTVYQDIPGVSRIKQELEAMDKGGQGSVWSVQKLLAAKLLKDP